MKILVELDPEKVAQTRNRVDGLKENFLSWAVDNESPAQYPADILWHLKTFDEVDKLILALVKKMREVESSKQQ